MISLDSTVVIDMVNDRASSLRDRLASALAQGEQVVISSLVLHEFAVGVEIRRSERDVLAFHELLGQVPVEPFTESDALEAAQLRAELQRVGQTLDGMDVLIAGQARARGWRVATANMKHFKRAPGLTVENWSAKKEHDHG